MSVGVEPSAGAWYAEGLRFECTRCGACCRGEGYVWVDEREARKLAESLDLDLDGFGKRYLRRVAGRLALVDGPDGACVFWRDGCSVYRQRPTQCRTFPFWSEHLASEAAWEEAARSSPGVNQGRLYAIGEIDALLAGSGEAGAEPTVDESDHPTDEED
jgi:Fe-S-cluster containining protein